MHNMKSGAQMLYIVGLPCRQTWRKGAMCSRRGMLSHSKLCSIRYFTAHTSQLNCSGMSTSYFASPIMGGALHLHALRLHAVIAFAAVQPDCQHANIHGSMSKLHPYTQANPVTTSIVPMLSCCADSIFLVQQADELSTQQRHHIAEGNALAGCQTLIQAAAKAWDSAQATSQASCQASMNQVQQEYLHAATRHLYYQRALLQLVLRQLNFCVSELQGTCRAWQVTYVALSGACGGAGEGRGGARKGQACCIDGCGFVGEEGWRTE